MTNRRKIPRPRNNAKRSNPHQRPGLPVASLTEQAFWNGEPCQAKRCVVIVSGDHGFPEFWGQHLVGQRTFAVEVDYGGERFYLYDGDGSGWAKVTAGGGSPRLGHKSLPVSQVLEYL